MGDNLKRGHARPRSSLCLSRPKYKTTYSSQEIQGQEFKVSPQRVSRPSQDADSMDSFILPFNGREYLIRNSPEIYRTTMGESMTLIIRCRFCRRNIPLIIKREGRERLISYTSSGDNSYWSKVTYKIKQHGILKSCRGSNRTVKGFHMWDDSLGNSYHLGTRYPRTIHIRRIKKGRRYRR